MKHYSGEAATKKGHKGAAFSGKTISAKEKKRCQLNFSLFQHSAVLGCCLGFR